MLFGAMVARSHFPEHPLSGAAYGALAGVLEGFAMTLVIAGTEIFLPRLRLGQALEQQPFAIVFLLKSVAYGTTILLVVGSKLGRWASAYLLFGPQAASDALHQAGFPVTASVAVALTVGMFTVVILQFSALIGARTLRSLWLGRYHRPRVEERFFLFVDIVGSTPIAERLGPRAVHEFLGRVFAVASDPIDEYEGEIYQYVGDEIVLSWTIEDGRRDARPIGCFFAIQEALDSAAVGFKRSFAAVPMLRGALHAGPVTAGEIGRTRRSIVYHGDVMNTASRIENATRDLDKPFLVSEDALVRMTGVRYSLIDLGSHTLRGRKAPIRLYAVAR